MRAERATDWTGARLLGMRHTVNGRKRTILLGLVLATSAACTASSATSTVAAPATADASASPAGAGCPMPPITLDALIQLDAERGPLAVRFDEGATVYHERARACFADTEIQFAGFVASPEGKGGVMTFSLSPEWLACLRSTCSQATRSCRHRPSGLARSSRSRSSRDRETRPQPSSAAGCRSRVISPDAAQRRSGTTSPAGSTPTVEEAIAICETTFVATAIEPITAP